MKARERKRRLHVSMRVALRRGMCSAGLEVGAGVDSKAVLWWARREERRERVLRVGEWKRRR